MGVGDGGGEWRQRQLKRREAGLSEVGSEQAGSIPQLSASWKITPSWVRGPTLHRQLLSHWSCPLLSLLTASEGAGLIGIRALPAPKSKRWWVTGSPRGGPELGVKGPPPSLGCLVLSMLLLKTPMASRPSLRVGGATPSLLFQDKQKLPWRWADGVGTTGPDARAPPAWATCRAWRVSGG